MKYVSFEEILAIHYRILRETNGILTIRDLTLLQSAVGRPRASFGGEEFYKTVWLKAAALMHSLILNHPFVDGNKRTAFAAIIYFLKINGLKFQADKKIIVNFVLGVEKKKHGLEEIAVWLKKHSEKVYE